MTKPLNIGVSGDKGSFSEEAALFYAKKIGVPLDCVYLIDMENVLEAIEAGKTDLGIFPIMNLRGGWVKPAFVAMGNHFFMPLAEIWLDVKQCLLALPGVTQQELTQIVSHPQGLAQCKNYLKREFPTIKQLEWIDTAKAANDLANGLLPRETAVIASKRAAEAFELKILSENIQDMSPNHTIFIVAQKKQGEPSYAGPQTIKR